MAEPAADLFDEIFAPADEVAAGLQLLARSQPLWPIGAKRWAAAVASVAAFEQKFGGEARMCNWSNLALYGLSSTALFASLANMGAAWLVARSGHRVAAVTAESILLIAPTCSRLRIFRGEPDPTTALAWSLCKAT
jgi:hypothetical protein